MGAYTKYRSEENRKKFEAARGSPASARKLARDFFSVVNEDCAGFKKCRSLLKRGRHRAALDVFVAWYLAEIGGNAALWAAITSSHEEFYNPLLSGKTTAGFLRNGFIHRLNHDHYYLGRPGEIDWSFDVSYYDLDRQFRDVFPVDYMLNLDQFYPLLDEYIRSGRQDALAAWSAFVDDHCLCRDALEPTHYPCDLGYNAGPLDIRGGVVYFLDYMRWLYPATRRYRHPFPSLSFARALMKNLKYYALKSVFYARANPQNWQEGLAHYLVSAGVLLKPFRLGAFLFNEGLRAIENYDQAFNLVDGSCLQRDLWYNYFWLNYGLGSIREILKHGAPEYLTPQWQSWFRLLLERRSKFLTRVLTSRGQHPIGTRATHGLTPPFHNWVRENREAFDRFTPWVYEDPMVTTFLNYVEGQSNPPPPFTSDAMPAGGYYYIRGGWTDDDQYGFLFAPKPPVDGMRHRAINMFGLNAFGSDLLVAGQQNSYDCPPSPALVDGCMQLTEVPALTFGHKRMIKYADAPIDHRTHTSAIFDMIEGVFAGWYGADARACDHNQINQLVDQAIKDVAHRRQVFFLRKQGVWIMLDTIAGKYQHDYTVQWYLPTQPVFAGWADKIKAYDPAEIVINEKEGSIATRASHMPNLAMYQSATAPFGYETEIVRRASQPPQMEAQGHDYCRISQRFARQEQVIGLTILFPEKSGAAGLAGIETLNPDSGLGRRFTAPDGAVVSVLVGRNHPVVFDSAGCRGRAQTAILMAHNGVFSGGLLLGCHELQLAGKPVAPNCNDFEFSRTGAIIPIYAPLPKVRILPDRPAFSEAVMVTMQCADPAVDIHYTLDGSEPTLAAPLFTGPVAVRKAAVIKARGFRKGIAAEPVTLHGTHATPLAFAVYEKIARRPAVAGPADLEPGLRYEYYRCGWKHFRDVILYPASQTPDKTGLCRELFDISARDTAEPFGFHYAGYLLAPAAGDYTFVAPEEFMDLTIDAGYDLSVIIDGILWRPSGRRHGYGTWTIGLDQGRHWLEVWFVDYRGDAQTIKFNSPRAYTHRIVFDRNKEGTGDLGPNFPGCPNLRNLIWTGVVPELQLRAPGSEDKTVLRDMLFRERVRPQL